LSHVALVIPGLDRIGGAERQVILLAKGLRRRGWRVTVVALSGTGGDTAAELSAASIGFLTLRMRKGLADPCGWIRFNRWLRRESPMWSTLICLMPPGWRAGRDWLRLCEWFWIRCIAARLAPWVGDWVISGAAGLLIE